MGKMLDLEVYYMAAVKDEITKNLLYYRKKSGLTQKELAEKIGVKNTAVSNWESGNNSIDIETLFSACEIFGVTLNDMYGRYSTSESSGAVLSQNEDRLLSAFRSLNQQGQEYIMQTVSMAEQVYNKNVDCAANLENRPDR